MRALIFAKRNLKEILREPLSYVFCIGFPVIMLLAFYFAFYSAETYWFGMETLAPGIAIFSFAFVMLTVALLVSKDRSTAFLNRLYTSPMTTTDFVLGYSIPGFVIATGQVIACFTTAAAIGLIGGMPLSLTGILLNMISTIPIMFLFVGLGILFGSLFSDKAAPGVSSIVITMSGFLSGAWMPVDPQSTLGMVCTALPFYPAVAVGRVALSMSDITFANFWMYLMIVCVYALVVYVLSVVVFRKKMSSDNA